MRLDICDENTFSFYSPSSFLIENDKVGLDNV